jgi:serine/threonine-protein kinase
MDHPDPDRHLLFGLLALQNGLIDQCQLILAFQAWTRDKARPLADHLVERGALDPDQRAAVEAMAALHLKKHGGDPERSLAALNVGRSTREGLAGVGDPQVDATLARVGSGSGPTENDDPSRTMTFSVGTATSDGQRFRVLRPHAKGGLGAVFVALDNELHREVALKQILDHHADDPTSRQRFLMEAEITGGLEHPGIVPVYGLGSYGDGRPYYAMRFVRGDSLKEAIEHFHSGAGRVAGVASSRPRAVTPDRGPADGTSATRRPTGIGQRSLELRRLLRRFLDVCNAIEYAHSRGVLHRDIKPGNVIVGRHGETLVVDWGLAKPLGKVEPGHDTGERTLMPASASGSAETLPGSALGTPAYMSPEQAAGDLDRLGSRSDVYSLGATLYCLLTGRAPFDGEAGEVLRKVQRGEFAPPRRVDPSIDKALEAVCLKAMATRPEDRYPSCRALADDVERWMADEPVAGWREPWTRTLVRWLTRHRTGVTGAAAAVLAGVVGLTAVLAVQASANARLSAANAELTRSKAAVQARYDLAVEAIKTFHTGVSKDFLLQQDQFKALRDQLLKSARVFYGKLSALLGKETDPASRRALAASNFELADLTDQVGNQEDALAAHRAVLSAREALAAGPGVDPAARVDVGRSLTAVARLLQGTGKTDEALATYRRSESLLAGLADPDPAARAALAACRSWLGYLLSTTGKTAEALAIYQRVRADQEALAAAPGAPAEDRRELAATVNRIGMLLQETGRPAEAEAAYREAREVYGKLAAENPAVTEFRSSLGAGHVNLGNLLSATDRPKEAEAVYREALEVYERLAAENPAVTDFRFRLARGHNNLGILLLQTGRPAEAEAAYRKALELRERLAADHPAVTQNRGYLAISHVNLGLLLQETGRPAEAEAAYRKALGIYERLAAENPAVTEFRSGLALGHNNLGGLLKDTGRPAEAEAEHRRALEVRKGLAEAEPGNPGRRRAVGMSLNNLGDLDFEAGRLDAAVGRFRESAEAHERLARDHPNVTDYRNGLAFALTGLGRAHHRAGRTAEAVGPLRRAAALREAIPTLQLGARYDLARDHALLASAAADPRSGLPAADAAAEADRAMAALRRAVAAGYRDLAYLRTDTDLDPLRGRDDFRLLMLDLAMPADPFAR